MKVLIISSKRVPKVSQRESKGAKREPKGAKSEPKGSQREPKVSHLEARGCQKWAKGRPTYFKKSIFGKGREKGAKSVRPAYTFWLPFGSRFPLKIPSKIHPKIDRGKTWKITPKGSQNGAEIDAKTHQCQNWYRKRSGKSWKIMFFWKGKTLILSAEHHTVVQKQASRGFVRGECANGKFIKKPSKMRSKSVPKSIQNRYKFHTRQSDAKNTENHPKWSSKGSQKPSTNLSKIGSKKR